MKMFIWILTILFSLSLSLFSQTFPPSIEKWSDPVRVDSFSNPYEYESEATLTNDARTIYYFKNDAIYTSNKSDSVWSSPVRLNGYINNGEPIRNTSLSRDGKRLYFCRWGGYGNWDLWYSDYIDSLKDWGPSQNMGPEINSPNGEYFAYEYSKDTLYIINNVWAMEGLCIYVKDSTNKWKIVDSSNYYNPFGIGHIRGLSITQDKRKAYLSQYVFSVFDTVQSDLFVTYWDTLLHHWGNTYELNINSHGFVISGWTEGIGGWDQYPWISPDGKTLYFTSNRDVAREDSTANPDIYISHLLIDENGNPVGIKDQPKPEIGGFNLYQNYPNPFNPATTIRYEIPHKSKISLKIFDLLGREIMTVIDEVKEKGKYEEKINVARISSGVYFYRLKADNYIVSKKMIFMK
ncbi:MAG: T9SS type A sorting domain-containing protein [Ignavibacteriaceae bacterium]|nr:T9SS type A sorting domain-containing protein [Ignavibacteriaceae bacterium]